MPHYYSNITCLLTMLIYNVTYIPQLLIRIIGHNGSVCYPRLSNGIWLVNILSALKWLLMSLYLLVGQLSFLDTENLSVSRCGFNSSHSYIKWSICWSSLPQGHVDESLILKRYRYALIFVCMYVCMYVCVCVCMYVFIYLFIVIFAVSM